MPRCTRRVSPVRRGRLRMGEFSDRPHECEQSKNRRRFDVSRLLHRARTYPKRSHSDAKVSHRDAKRSHSDAKVSHCDAKRSVLSASVTRHKSQCGFEIRQTTRRFAIGKRRFEVAKTGKHPKNGFWGVGNCDLRRSLTRSASLARHFAGCARSSSGVCRCGFANCR